MSKKLLKSENVQEITYHKFIDDVRITSWYIEFSVTFTNRKELRIKYDQHSDQYEFVHDDIYSYKETFKKSDDLDEVAGFVLEYLKKLEEAKSFLKQNQNEN